MRLLLIVSVLICNFFAIAQTTTTYTGSTTWTVPAGVFSISVKVYGGAGGTGGQDCGSGCTNAVPGNAGYVEASFAVTPGIVVGIYPGGQGLNGASAATGNGGGLGGIATYTTAFNGGKGGNAGATGSSGAGGGGAATVVTIATIIRVVAGGAGGGGGMANQAASGYNGANTYSPNGISNTGGMGTTPAGDGGGGGGGGGGNFGSLGGTTHAAGAEQAGNGGNLGGNLISAATTTISNSNIAWTSGGRIDLTYTSSLPVTWLSFTAVCQASGGVLLKWRTATELNSRSYSIQRSTNGYDWLTVGNVAAAGNSNAVSLYQFTDPARIKSTYYYRLAQIDIDDKINYSKTVICAMGQPTVKLYPNPVKDGRVQVSLAATSFIIIYNSNGEILMNKKLPQGDNKLDLTNYPPGVYFFKAGEQKIPFVIK